MVARSSLIVVLFAFILAGKAMSQPRIQPHRAQFASWVISSGKDSVVVCTAYSIPFNNLIFIKSSDTSSSFSAALSFSIDAIDSATGTNFHGFAMKRIVVSGFAATQSKIDQAQYFVTLAVPRSIFRIRAELRDETQKITYLQTSFRRNFTATDSSGITSIVFLDSLSGGRFYPVMGDKVAPFPAPLRFVILTSRPFASAPVFYLLRKDGSTIKGPDSTRGLSGSLRPVGTAASLYFSPVADSSSRLFVGEVKIDTLNEGMYELRVDAGPYSKTLRFHYSWLNKPLTLRNLKTALSLLKYIVPDSLYSEINSGNEKEKREKLDAFWKTHDPTPKTAYNELEAEYYERADYAFTEFRTLGTRNGAATDRGKAYILYGKPQSIERELKSDGTYELWKYPNLKKILVFKEKNFGEFILYQTEKL